MMDFKVGFARITANPPMGIRIAGYYVDRRASGILDDLEFNALALKQGEKTSLLIVLDNVGIKQQFAKDICVAISNATGVSIEGICFSQTHSHTAPDVIAFNERFGSNDYDESIRERYNKELVLKACEVARLALLDLKPARMGYGVGVAPNVAFVRRFRMKDGSVRTNPGVNNPDIVAPIGDVDERVNVIRFDRENAETIVYVNFANHPDTVGGTKISADWPGFARRTVEKVLDNVKCIFFNGAQGDVNHVNVSPKGGFFNDMSVDFDDVARGYGHTRYIGRVIAAGVLQAFDKVKYVDNPSLDYQKRVIKVPSNKPEPKDVPNAIKINEMHLAGKDNELPYTGMMLTTIVAEAGRMVRLKDGPDFFEMTLSGVKIGPVGIIGIPGEPFTGIGRALKETEGYEMICPTCATCGYEGYFPMKDAYDEGGYEARCSNFASCVAEIIITEGKELLSSLK